MLQETFDLWALFLGALDLRTLDIKVFDLPVRPPPLRFAAPLALLQYLRAPPAITRSPSQRIHYSLAPERCK